MNLTKKNFKKIIIEFAETIVGAGIMGIATALFLLPNELSSGGFSGIATIFYYFLKIPMGYTILALNIPLLLIAVYKLGKSFVIKSILGTFIFSSTIDFLDKFEPITQNKFLACVYGGVLIGIGTAIILKANASTGGSDLISAIVKAYNPHIRMGKLITIIDVVIVSLNVLFFKKIEIGLYSAIAIYLMGKMIDIVFEGVNFTKLLIIISDKNEEISDAISEKVNKGTTGIFGKGMYTNQNKLILLCAASRGDVGKVKQVAKEIDENSFIIVANAREVMGLGFNKM